MEWKRTSKSRPKSNLQDTNLKIDQFIGYDIRSKNTKFQLKWLTNKTRTELQRFDLKQPLEASRGQIQGCYINQKRLAIKSCLLEALEMYFKEHLQC